MGKTDLRRHQREMRAGLPRDLVDGWSAAIAGRLEALDQWRDASVVHCYVGALPGEVRTKRLIERAHDERKRVICPRVRPHGQLEHREVSAWPQLVESTFGLREPDPDLCPPVDPGLAELIVAPGVAFSEDGSRLGMGGGYYDRFLAEQSAPRVGLAFEMQLVDAVPRAPHDEPVDLIVTELRVIRCA